MPPDLVDEELLRSDRVQDWLAPAEVERVRELCRWASTPEGRREMRLMSAGTLIYGLYEPGDAEYPGAEEVTRQALSSIARGRRRAAVVAWAATYGLTRMEAARRLGLRWA